MNHGNALLGQFVWPNFVKHGIEFTIQISYLMEFALIFATKGILILAFNLLYLII